MTKITFFRKKDGGGYIGFEVNGHAGFGEAGEDVVCSALSALIINTVNSIDALTEEKMEVEATEDEAHIKVSFDDVPGKDAILLIRSLALGLTNIEAMEGASEYISVNYEEV